MNTIVVNTLRQAVTEYDWTFDSISATRATSAAGLFTLGGDDDAGEPIAAHLLGGTPGGGKIQLLGNVYLGVHGAGEGALVVQGRESSWEYPVEPRSSGVAKVKPGKGIKEAYVGFGYKNVAGADFRIDRIDAEVTPHTSRRK
jgi:hypothetical protein